MNFERIAPFLADPLILSGFAILLFYGLLKVLLRAKIIPQVSVRTGGNLVKSLLKYGFIVALVTILLGFGIEFYRDGLKEKVHPPVAGSSKEGGDAKTTGPNSPAVTGNGNDIHYDQSAPSSDKRKSAK